MNLFGTVLGFAGFFKSRDYGSARIDNIPFRLHYSFSSGFLFLATALLGLNDLFGKEIQCHSLNGGASNMINQYCWVSGTYTVPGADGPDENTRGIAAKPKTCMLPNEKSLLDCESDGTCVERRKESKDGDPPRCAETQSYYQWVPFILMFQGLIFMLPHRLWVLLEEGKMKSITDGVRLGTSIISDEKEKTNTIKNISKFIHRQNKSSGHSKYAFGFLGCLVLSFLNVLFNFWFLNVVFKGKFNLLGLRWLQQDFDVDNKILREAFPRMTACVWSDFGTGNRQQYENYVCIMAANILNEKIFVFLWFWYIVLAVISAGCVLYYCVLLLSTSENVRSYYLQYAVKNAKIKEEVLGDRSSQKSTPNEKTEGTTEKVESYMRKLPRSNFFFLYFLAHNVEFSILRGILRELASLESSPPGYGAYLRSQSVSPMLSAHESFGNESDVIARAYSGTFEASKRDHQ